MVRTLKVRAAFLIHFTVCPLIWSYNIGRTGTQPRFIPSAPPPARHALLTALRAAHSSLLTPPPVVAEDPEKLTRWSPRLRQEVDWDSVEQEGASTGAHAGEEGWDGKQRRRKKVEREFVVRKDEKRQEGDEEAGTEEEADSDGEQDEEEKPQEKKGDDAYPFLTVGLIGKLPFSFHSRGIKSRS